MGLFGFDLTTFLDYCWYSYEEDITNCAYEDIAKKFDGWALGLHWQMPDYTVAYEYFDDLWDNQYLFVCVDGSCSGTKFEKSCDDGSGTYSCVEGYVYCSENLYSVTTTEPATTNDLDFRQCQYYYNFGFSRNHWWSQAGFDLD